VIVAALLVIVHAVSAARVSVAAVKVIFAPPWPESATTVVKVVVPQPDVLGVSEPDNP